MAQFKLQRDKKKTTFDLELLVDHRGFSSKSELARIIP
jgi:hypothetical protein